MVKLACPPEFEDTLHLPPDVVLYVIGRMTIVSGGIEDLLHNIYWKFAKLKPEAGAIITGDLNPNRLMADIIKICRATKADPRVITDLQDIFSEYKPLATKRNQCVHWIWWPADTEPFKIEPPSYKPGRMTVNLTLREIAIITDQLTWIEARLYPHSLDARQLASMKKQLGDKADVQMPTPWLDKPLPPDPKQSSRRRTKK